ncbi:hypothetical protein ACWDR0_00540 [Streptomyces sp. NPDC003691]
MAEQHSAPRGTGGLCAFAACCTRRNSTVRPVGARMPELARSLTLFRHVQAVTAGPAARIEQAGSYAVPSLCGEPFTVRPGAVALRLDGAAVTAAEIERDGGTGAVTLLLYAAGGRIAHRGRLLSEADRLLAELVGPPAAGPSTAPAAGSAVPAREDGDQLARLDAILLDGGAARHAASTRYRGEHRPLDPGAVPALLENLHATGLPVDAAVFAPAAAQACRGPVRVTDTTTRGRVFAVIGDASLEIDLPAVRAARLVRSTAAHGPVSAIELDDAEGRCAAVLTQFGTVGEDVHTAWERLTASLPGGGAGTR